MALYKIKILPSVDKDFRSIPVFDRNKILKRIGNLAANPRPRGCKKLIGQNRYRVQQGDYRIIYTILDKELIVWVVKVGNRRDVYHAREEKVVYRADKKLEIEPEA